MAKTMQSNLANLECCEVEIADPERQAREGNKTLVLLATDHLGKGDDNLGGKIVINFIRTMKEMGDDLWRLVLLNGGSSWPWRVRKLCPNFRNWPEKGWASWSAAPA